MKLSIFSLPNLILASSLCCSFALGQIGLEGIHGRNTGAGVTTKPAQPTQKATRILFIGNSFTYCNDLPGLFNAMALSQRIPLTCDSVVAGGATLQMHWENKRPSKSLENLKNDSYRFVILQDQSSTPVARPNLTLQFANKFCELANSHNAKPVMFLTWGYLKDQTNPAAGLDNLMQDGLNKTYVQAAKQGKALIAPVGVAFQKCLQKYPKTPLYAEDGQHPSAIGSYLAACVFYKTIIGKSPVGLPGKLVLNTRTLCNIPTNQARALQEIALDACQEFSLEKMHAAYEKEEAKFITQEEFQQKIKKGMSYDEFVSIVGKPTSSNDRDMCYQFHLRGDFDVIATFKTEQKILDSAIFTSNKGEGGMINALK